MDRSLSAPPAASRGAATCTFPRPGFGVNVGTAQPLAASGAHVFEPNTLVSIRILIADDHAIVRAGLQQFIADESDLEVVGEAGTGTEALAFIRSQPCDVVLLDISMPDLNGVDALLQRIAA